MYRFFSIIRNKNIRILILYGGLRNIIYIGSGLFAFYVLSFLSASPRILGIVISVGFLASAIGSILGGYLADEIGRRRTLVVSSLLGGFSWIGLSLSRDWFQVAFSFGFANGMMACALPAFNAAVSDSVPEDVGGGLGALNLATSIASSFGALLGAAIAQFLGFETLFGLISVPWFLSAYPALRINERKGKEPEKQIESKPLNPFHMLKQNPNLLVLSSSVFIVTLGGYVSSFYPDYMKTIFNVTSLQIGVFDYIYSMVWAITNYPMGLMSDRWGRKMVIVPGYALMGLAWILFPISNSLQWLFVLYAVYSLGNSMGYYTTALVMDVSPNETKGTAVGIFNCFMYVGVFLSGILGGVLWEYLGALASFRIASLTSIIAALIILFKIDAN